MKLLERISSLGPWLTHPVTATVACTREEAQQLPGVVWQGVAAYTGGEYRAHLEGRDLATANKIMALDKNISPR